MITVSQFKQLFSSAQSPEAWLAALNEYMPRYGISATAQFLAQCGHESCGFTDVSENLNYSATALIATWPKRFPQEIANQYARKPEAIANRAYANRMGNGPEESGDGWKYRGRGVIQITGRDNYTEFCKVAGIPLEQAPGYLLTIDGAVHSACWWWKAHGCNELVSDMTKLTKRINGGVNGLTDRLVRYELAGRVLA